MTEEDITDKVWNQVSTQEWAWVWDKIGELVSAELEEQIWERTSNAIWGSIGEPVRDQIWVRSTELVKNNDITVNWAHILERVQAQLKEEW
jgi:hypothetical protein